MVVAKILSAKGKPPSVVNKFIYEVNQTANGTSTVVYCRCVRIKPDLCSALATIKQVHRYITHFNFALGFDSRASLVPIDSSNCTLMCYALCVKEPFPPGPSSYCCEHEGLSLITHTLRTIKAS